jgi:hypothetical protein
MSPARTTLGAFFIGAGLMHFARPRLFLAWVWRVCGLRLPRR